MRLQRDVDGDFIMTFTPESRLHQIVWKPFRQHERFTIRWSVLDGDDTDQTGRLADRLTVSAPTQ